MTWGIPDWPGSPGALLSLSLQRYKSIPLPMAISMGSRSKLGSSRLRSGRALPAPSPQTLLNLFHAISLAFFFQSLAHCGFITKIKNVFSKIWNYRSWIILLVNTHRLVQTQLPLFWEDGITTFGFPLFSMALFTNHWLDGTTCSAGWFTRIIKKGEWASRYGCTFPDRIELEFGYEKGLCWALGKMVEFLQGSAVDTRNLQ